MIINYAGSHHDVPDVITWVSPMRIDSEIEYTLEWEEKRRLNGYSAEESMPPSDVAAAYGETDDGRKIPGFIRLSSFTETAMRKQFVSAIKKAPEFQPLYVYRRWAIDLNGRAHQAGETRGQFLGYEWISWEAYISRRRAEFLDYSVIEPPISQRVGGVNIGWQACGIFVAKIRLPILEDGGTEREEILYYPLHRINSDIYTVYQNIGDKYDLSNFLQNALAFAAKACTIVSFDVNALEGEKSVFEIVKNYCDAMGYGLQVQSSGDYWSVQEVTLTATAFHTPQSGVVADNFISKRVGEKCRLVGKTTRTLKGQHNYVVVGEKKLWGTTINDPLLPVDATVAESECVAIGTHDEGLELYVSRSGDAWGSANPASHYILRSDLWPDKLISFLGSWDCELQTNFFDTTKNRNKPFFQYENWIFSLQKVIRNKTIYSLSGAITSVIPIAEYDYPQVVATQGIMTPNAVGREFYHYIPAGDYSSRFTAISMEIGGRDNWVADFEEEMGPNGYGRGEGRIIWNTPIGVGIVFKQRVLTQYYNYDSYEYTITGLEAESSMALAWFAATEISQAFTVFTDTTDTYELVERLAEPLNILLECEQNAYPREAKLIYEEDGVDVEEDLADYELEDLLVGPAGAQHRCHTYGRFPTPIKAIRIRAHGDGDARLRFITSGGYYL